MRDRLDAQGLICGFRLNSAAPMQSLELDDLHPEELEQSPHWLHFRLADVRARSWIAECSAIPLSAREFLLSPDRHIGFEEIPDGLLATIGDQRQDEAPGSFDVLRLFVGPRIMVSARLHPLRGVDQLRRDAESGLIVGTAPQLAAQLMRRISQMFAHEVATLSKAVDDAEERLLAGSARTEARSLGRVRYLLARLRRHMAVCHDDELEARLECWCSEEDCLQLRRALRRMVMVAQDLELIQVRARLVQEELLTQLGEATNRNLLFLSIVTSLMLPVTLVSGIFGMNVRGLPLTEEPWGFWAAMILMGVTLALTIVILRWRRLL